MAIETVQRAEGQTKLISESREERLSRLFDLEMSIQDVKIERQKHVDVANSLKNSLKKMESDKVDLLNLINSGQGTFISVAASVSIGEPEGLDDDMPTDEELEQYADAPEGEEVAEEQAQPSGESVLQAIESMFSDCEVTLDPESEPVSEGDAENTSEIIPEDGFETAKPDHWVLSDVVGAKRYGVMPSKAAPNVGDILTLPVSMRRDGKVSFQVEGFTYFSGQDESGYEVFCTLLSDAERMAIKAGESI